MGRDGCSAWIIRPIRGAVCWGHERQLIVTMDGSVRLGCDQRARPSKVNGNAYRLRSDGLHRLGQFRF